MSHEFADQPGDIVGSQAAWTAFNQRRQRAEQAATGRGRCRCFRARTAGVPLRQHAHQHRRADRQLPPHHQDAQAVLTRNGAVRFHRRPWPWRSTPVTAERTATLGAAYASPA